MAHAKAKLTPLGRQLLIKRIIDEGWPVRAAAESMGVSAQTAYKWLRRFRSEGAAGLVDLSSRPVRSPGMSPERLVAQIRELRLTRRLARTASAMRWVWRARRSMASCADSGSIAWTASIG